MPKICFGRTLESALNSESLQAPRRATIAQTDSSGGGGVADLFADVEVAEITSARDKTTHEDFAVSKSKARVGRDSFTTTASTTTDDSGAIFNRNYFSLSFGWNNAFLNQLHGISSGR